MLGLGRTGDVVDAALKPVGGQAGHLRDAVRDVPFRLARELLDCLVELA